LQLGRRRRELRSGFSFALFNSDLGLGPETDTEPHTENRKEMRNGRAKIRKQERERERERAESREVYKRIIRVAKIAATK
jgi:hypothetical protein